MNYKELTKVNSEIKTTPVKGKNYAEVKERINAFRKIYPEGFIKTEPLYLDENRCEFHAQVGYYFQKTRTIDIASSEVSKTVTELIPIVLGEGTACEYRSASNINKTSYVENCETSAIGRALGVVGIGIDVALASADEMRYVETDAPVVTAPTQKADPELKAVKEQFAATIKNHGLNGVAVCNHFGIGSKPDTEQLLKALEVMADMITKNTIPEEWRI